MKCGFRRHVAGAMAVLALAACGDSGVGQLQQWMVQVRQQTRAVVAPLREPEKFIPFAYAASALADPFDPHRLRNGLPVADAALKPDMRRPKQFLESFPLDMVRMVGTMHMAGVTYALLQIDKAVYHVQSGQYVGQDFGQVVSIAENAVMLRERVQDAAGKWSVHLAQLELQTAKEAKK